eukprot:TRINITY_DN15501_c0_g1_i4.p3 TRINITY_DN15501_c0_g1~~TRINITY_DN15501_c0_g1_i4.p3  ORF type:complete len:109 (+),score=8.94 TRINITY_DN15501_c0_g1_i4:406-732(+)
MEIVIRKENRGIVQQVRMLFRRVELSVFFPHIFYLEVWKTMVQRLFSLLFQNVFKHGLEKLQKSYRVEKSTQKKVCVLLKVVVYERQYLQKRRMNFKIQKQDLYFGLF